MWESPAIPVPIDAGDDTEFPDLPWVKAALSGGWWSVIYGYADVTWIRFDPRLADQATQAAAWRRLRAMSLRPELPSLRAATEHAE